MRKDLYHIFSSNRRAEKNPADLCIPTLIGIFPHSFRELRIKTPFHTQITGPLVEYYKSDLINSI